jgi:ribosomal protein S27AE
MGTVLSAVCACGLNQSVTVGSSMAQHGKVFKFPYRCLDCSAIESLDVLAKNNVCTYCGGSSLLSYAASTKTLSTNSVLNVLSSSILLWLGFHRISDVFCDFYVHGLRRSLAILKTSQFCPKCKSHTLDFSIDFYFD